MTLKIGLTGGIGSGKTTVSNMFAELGIPVIDADVIARKLVQPGSEALTAILDQFGDHLLLENGELNRTELRNIVFVSDNKRKQLEAILHPRIDREMQRESQNITAPYCIFSIPLLFEANKQAMVDRILVVDSPLELQYQRTQQRDGLSEKQVAATIAAQASRETRLAAADDIICNDGDLLQLTEEVNKLHLFYQTLAKAS